MESRKGYKEVPALSEAIDYVESLDRTRLGKFAVHADVLAAAIYEMMLRGTFFDMPPEQKDEVKFKLAQAKVFLVTEESRIYGRNSEVGGLHHKVMGEVCFWLVSHGHSDVVYERADQLQVVFDSPESYHPYYKLGIWDKDAVARFIAEDIDPELAMAAYRD